MGGVLSLCGCKPSGPSQHHSIHSADQAMILFHNATQYIIGLYWMDYRGRKRLYYLLPAGHFHLQYTFLSHPWTFEIIGSSGRDSSIFKNRDGDINEINCSSVCAETHEKVVYAHGNDVRKVTIVESPPVHWCIYSHAQHFHSYKSAVETILLCHSRLRNQGGARDKANLGDLPLVS